MGVEHALGSAGRPRRVHHHHYRRRIDTGSRFGDGRHGDRFAQPSVALASHHDDILSSGRAAQPLEHCAVIVLAEHLGHEDQLRRAIGEDVFELSLAIDRRDRIDHQPDIRAASAITAVSIQFGSWNETTSPGLRPRDRKKPARRRPGPSSLLA